MDTGNIMCFVIMRMVVTKIHVCTDYVVKTYPDDVNEQLQKFVGQKIEMGE